MPKNEILIRATHKRLLDLFEPVSDKVAFGIEEYWHSFAAEATEGVKFRGDCDDFMLTACDVLRAAGVDPSDMWLCAVKTASGEGHAVLVAEGWLVDNTENTIWPSGSADYRWIKAMRVDSPGVWLNCVDHRPPA